MSYTRGDCCMKRVTEIVVAPRYYFIMKFISAASTHILNIILGCFPFPACMGCRHLNSVTWPVFLARVF